jgi:hypothetical protein
LAPDLSGRYIFGDYAVGRIWSMAYDGVSAPVVSDLCSMTPLSLSSFGLDQAGEIYLCSFLEGKILKLNHRPDPTPTRVLTAHPAPDRFELNFTNLPGLSFSVIGTTNLTSPISNWSWLGLVPEVYSGGYSFTNTQFANSGSAFFRVRQP